MLNAALPLTDESKHARLRGHFTRNYLTTIGSTPVLSVVEGIAAGTSEIQRGIIANRGLGLSRG
jgi:hypothetical protein